MVLIIVAFTIVIVKNSVAAFVYYFTSFGTHAVWATIKNRIMDRSSRWLMLFNIGVLKNFAIFTGKYPCWSLFLIRLQAWKPRGLKLYWKETPTHVFSHKYCGIFKNSFFYRTFPLVALLVSSFIEDWYAFTAKTQMYLYYAAFTLVYILSVCIFLVNKVIRTWPHSYIKN